MTVFVREEYTYRWWIWLCPFQEEQTLAAWWRGVTDAGQFGANGRNLVRAAGGKIQQISTERMPKLPPGTATLDVHTDNDSLLTLSTGEEVLHAGHVSDEVYFAGVEEALERAESGETIDPAKIFSESALEDLDNWEAVRAAALSEMDK